MNGKEGVMGINLIFGTGKSLTEALIVASTNPQYDKTLFIELQGQFMKIARAEHQQNICRTCCLHKFVFCFCFNIQNNLCTQHVVSFEFSCTELLIQ